MTYVSDWQIKWYPNKNRRVMPSKKLIDEVCATLNPLAFRLNNGKEVVLKPKQAAHKKIVLLLQKCNV